MNTHSGATCFFGLFLNTHFGATSWVAVVFHSFFLSVFLLSVPTILLACLLSCLFSCPFRCGGFVRFDNYMF